LPLFGYLDNFSNFVLNNIAGIDANAVRAIFDGVNGQLMLKMNIRNERNVNAFLIAGIARAAPHPERPHEQFHSRLPARQ